MGFLHGTETITTVAGSRMIQEVKSGIVFLVGTAPIHAVAAGAPAVNALSRCVTDTDDAKFGGVAFPGYSIPKALQDIRGEKGATVLVCNVFDPAVHKTDVVEATLTITAKKIALAHGDITALTVKTVADVVCVEGTDYTVDKLTGIITVKGSLNVAASAKVAYSYADPSQVDAVDIIGAVSVGGVRSGAQTARNGMSLFGVNPKLLIAPGFSSDASVEQALTLLAEPLRAMALVDVAIGSSLEDVLEGRLPAGALSLLSTSYRTIYCYPHAKVPVPGGGTELRPLSQILAGSIARTDNEIGYWRSPSNRKLNRVIGTELPLTAAINDETCDTNRLNEVGIVTIFSAGTSGIRTWGNRSAAFPSEVDILTFIAPKRVTDMVAESIELATLTHLDGPINDVLIKAVLGDVNEYIRSLVGRGALVAGSDVQCLPEKNPTAQLAAGKIVFTRNDCPPPPAERITFEQTVDTTLLANIFGG